MQEMELISRYNRGQRDFARVDLQYSKLQNTNLCEVSLEGSWLSWSDLSGANLSKANLRKAHFQETDLRGANLREADLREARLRKADLSGADLSYANLESADLRGAILIGSDLTGAILQGSSVSDKQLTQARSLSGAIAPEGLTKFSDEGVPITIVPPEEAVRSGSGEVRMAGGTDEQPGGCIFSFLERWPNVAATTAAVAAISTMVVLATLPLNIIVIMCPGWIPSSNAEVILVLMPITLVAAAIAASFAAITSLIGHLLATVTCKHNWRVGCGCVGALFWGLFGAIIAWFLAILTTRTLC
jgi:hypothetical protein